MGYFHIEFSPFSKHLCTIATPFGKYEYQRLPSCSTFEEHLQKLELVFSRLSETGLKVNANKSHFPVSEIEYLGYWITRNSIQPVPKKVEAIQCIAPPTTRKQV
jgi:hypothetical protein